MLLLLAAAGDSLLIAPTGGGKTVLAAHAVPLLAACSETAPGPGSSASAPVCETRCLSQTTNETEKPAMDLNDVGVILAQEIAAILAEGGRLPGVVALLDSYPAEVWRDEPEPDPVTALRALLAMHVVIVVGAAILGLSTLAFTAGIGQVIKGWDDGLLGMKEGGRRKITIPPHLGYGDRGAGAAIKGGETLIFVVDLVKVG